MKRMGEPFLAIFPSSVSGLAWPRAADCWLNGWSSEQEKPFRGNILNHLSSQYYARLETKQSKQTKS